MTINLKIPESWNDLNAWQLKKIAAYSHSNLSGDIFDYKVFLVLLNIRWWQFRKKWKAQKTIRNAGFSSLKEHYTWLQSDLNLTTFIPKIKVKSINWHAPSDRINNLTIDEFSHAEDLYLGWFNSKDIEYLQYLAAVLYREKDAKKKRIIFDKTELNSRAKSLANLHPQTLLAILLSYQGSRAYVFSQFPTVFPKPKGKSKPPKTSGFGKLVLHFSGGKFGTHNETKTTNLYTFLSEFENQLKNKPYA